ncbi:hypothetical protein [Rhodococcus sp. UNC363MFTsu5.1]|uniref:hypothetical protein n=1 Tax=Rhodococcus sp. UNC363MFTsu5.1 TaxID=1449069 RepID=UPI00068A7056|nr:hypothetical protein [Rhodococcus sp. UNC363MFTsu5.1]
MPPKQELTPEIEAAIREGHAIGTSQADISRTLGISQDMVSRWAKRLGLLWNISPAVAVMNDKTRERLSAQRAVLAEALLADAIAMRERIWDTYEFVASTPAGPQTIKLDLPDAKATAEFTAAVERLIKSHENLTRMGAGHNADAAASVLVQMQEALAQFAAELDDEAAGE